MDSVFFLFKQKPAYGMRISDWSSDVCSSDLLAASGARVLLACRDEERARDALASVAAEATGAAPEVVLLDLADLDSVAAAAEDVATRVDRLDILLNNAGVMAIPLRRTPQGHEAQLGTNHPGHFALTGRPLPVLPAPGPPRPLTPPSFLPPLRHNPRA